MIGQAEQEEKIGKRKKRRSDWKFYQGGVKKGARGAVGGRHLTLTSAFLLSKVLAAAMTNTGRKTHTHVRGGKKQSCRKSNNHCFSQLFTIFITKLWILILFFDFLKELPLWLKVQGKHNTLLKEIFLTLAALWPLKHKPGRFRRLLQRLIVGVISNWSACSSFGTNCFDLLSFARTPASVAFTNFINL